jgi:excisionase family DNA binding protein
VLSGVRIAQKEARMNLPPIVLTVSEACALGRFGRTFFYKMISSGKLRAMKNGSRTVVLASDLTRLLENLPQISPKRSRDVQVEAVSFVGGDVTCSFRGNGSSSAKPDETISSETVDDPDPPDKRQRPRTGNASAGT